MQLDGPLVARIRRCLEQFRCPILLKIVVRHILKNPTEVAEAASIQAASLIRAALAERGGARIVAATGASQIQFLELLTAQRDIPWRRVTVFHLD